MIKQFFKKLKARLTYGINSTKYCPNCGSTQLMKLSTMNMKVCYDCGEKFKWERHEDEPLLFCFKKMHK